MSTISKVPKISIVMAAYNAADYLQEAIKSILNQTFTNFEFIIIDDGSKDATPMIIANYKNIDSRIRVITQKKNSGLINALNIGFRAARGKYIARMDADDVSLPKRLEKEYEYMENHPNIVIVGTQAAYIDEKGKPYKIEAFLLDDNEIRTEIMIRNQQFRHGAVLIRRSAVCENNEFYDPTAVHYEDFEYWPRLLRHGKGANLPEVLYLYRRTPTSLTATKKDEMRVGTAFVVNRQLTVALLPYFGWRQVKDVLRKRVTYKPRTTIINHERLHTNLRWVYQSYLFGLSELYAKKGKYLSALLIMAISFSIGPFRYLNTVTAVIVKHIYPFKTSR